MTASTVDHFPMPMLAPQWSLCCETADLQQGVGIPQRDSDYGLVPPKFLEFKADDGTTLYGQLLLPPNSPPERFLSIMYVYGGPAAQLVPTTGTARRVSSIKFFCKKASRSSPSTTAARPTRPHFSTAIRHQYGVIELKDQLAALNRC